MHSRKLHPYSVAALFFPVKSWLITLLNQSGAVSYPSCSQALVNVSVCCCGLRYFVVVVRLFSFVFYCEITTRTVLPLCGKTDYCKPCTATWAYKVCVVTKFGWYAYCSDDIIHVTHTVRCTSRTQWSILWALWYSCEWALTDTEEKELLNKVVIFVFFAHKIILVAS